jgi:hypothetical protein
MEASPYILCKLWQYGNCFAKITSINVNRAKRDAMTAESIWLAKLWYDETIVIVAQQFAILTHSVSL